MSSDDRTCGICANEYGGRVVPTLLSCCENHVCFDCAENDRNAKISQLTGNKKWINCIYCNKPFHSSRETPWTVMKPFIKAIGIKVDMTAVREAQAAMKIVPGSKRRRRNNQREIQGEAQESEGASASLAPTELATPNPRRSQRLIPREGGAAENTGTDLSVTLDGITHSEESPTSSVVGPSTTEDQMWQNAVAHNNVNVYRVRCFNTESKTDDDRYARKCPQWCVNNGCIITCSEIANVLPETKRSDGEALREKVSSVDCVTLLREVHASQHQGFKYCLKKRHLRTFMQFVGMRKGDIVVLHTKGGTSRNDPPQTLTFGVIEDERLAITSKDDAIENRAFPWDFNDPGADTTHRTGIMEKKVRWLRQGELRKVRGKSQVNWLAEREVIWFATVGGKTPSHLNEAVENMRSDRFLSNTRAINNEWVMG